MSDRVRSARRALPAPALLTPALLTLALVLTQVWFPDAYFDYVGTFHDAGAVLARNLTLVALFAVLAWPDEVARRPSIPQSQ